MGISLRPSHRETSLNLARSPICENEALFNFFSIMYQQLMASLFILQKWRCTRRNSPAGFPREKPGHFCPRDFGATDPQQQL